MSDLEHKQQLALSPIKKRMRCKKFSRVTCRVLSVISHKIHPPLMMSL